MKYILSLILVLTFSVSIGQVYNPTPQYVFKNRLGVGRSTPVDSAAYMNVGPNGGAVAGIVLPRIADTLTISGTKRHGLLIFSNQLNKFAWYDSTNTRWVEVGSGSSSSGEVMLMNGSRTVGDSLLFPTITGDTAYIRNLLAGSGLLFENMGDTVLKLNVDSSTVPNIYNSDGMIDDDLRYIEMSRNSTLYITDSGRNVNFITIDDYLNSGFGSTVYIEAHNKGGTLGRVVITGQDSDSTSKVALTSSNIVGGVSYDITLNLDTSGINLGGSLTYGLTDKPSSSNAVQQSNNSIYVLSDLTSAAASRTFTTIPKSNGSYLKIINQSSDATYKWTFAGITVYDKNGSTVTAIDDHTVYELIYISAGQSEFGAGWHIINKY